MLRYANFYKQLQQEFGQAEQDKNPLNDKERLNDTAYLTRSLLANPFEKFERKRFIYHAKDLNIISFDSVLWEKLDENALADYLKNINAPFIIQELIDYPLELSVLHYRMPDAEKGKITSICIKKTLSVVGDGQSTVLELMQKMPRATLQLARFQSNYPERLTQIPAKGKEVELEPIANHSRGTTFLNGNHLHSEKLEKAFDKIAFQMDDIYYGRFDLKCQSIELLEEGKELNILEFNGVAGEPAHIYDPSFPVWKAYRDIYKHFKIIYKISEI